MENKGLISVIINCYNSEIFLQETIDSILSQTYTHWELIFWDNCSTDGSAEIVKQIQDPRVRYFIAKEKTPLGMARNLAMEKVKGDYICFLDADDIWMPTFLEESVNVLSSNMQIGLAYTRYIHFSNNEEEWLSKGSGNSGIIEIKKLIRGYNIGMSAALFRRSIIERCLLGFDTNFSLIEDFDFFLKLAAVSDVYYIATPLMRYRHHDHNASHSNKWSDELGMMLNNIKDKDVYKPLMPYYRQIKNLRGYYNIVNNINNGRKLSALGNIIEQCPYDFGVMRYLIFLVIGKDFYYKLRKTINSKFV